MVDLENNRTTRSIVLRKYIVTLFRLHRRLHADYIDYKVVCARGRVSCWHDLVIKSTFEPKRCPMLTQLALVISP